MGKTVNENQSTPDIARKFVADMYPIEIARMWARQYPDYTDFLVVSKATRGGYGTGKRRYLYCVTKRNVVRIRIYDTKFRIRFKHENPNSRGEMRQIDIGRDGRIKSWPKE